MNDAGVQKPLDHHAYDYDPLDRIQKHTGITGASWNYGYNATGEVSKATQKMPDALTDYFGRDYRYQFDGIGNRTSVQQSRDSNNPARIFNYTPNALNQYISISHPNLIDLTGVAGSLANVTVNGIAASRQERSFYKELTQDNSTTPRWLAATIADGNQTINGSLLLPKAATIPSYDDDGNLTNDGQWIYSWDAENRLLKVERTPAAITGGAPYIREEHDYDSLGRRIRTSLYTSSNATTPSEQTIFIFDGWKCIAELNALSNKRSHRKRLCRLIV